MTIDVSIVPQKLETVCCACVVLSCINLPVPRNVWNTCQLEVLPLDFPITISGATPKPCPKVNEPDDAWVKVQILNPAVVFTETLDVIEPSVFDDAEHQQPKPKQHEYYQSDYLIMI